MDHAADFHGDQLRLSVILRAAEKVPERPRRLQRNKQAPPSPATPQQRPSTVFVPTTTGFESSVKLAQDETSKASGDTMSELDARVQPSEHASDASEDDPSSGADSSSSTSGSAQYREPPIPDTERQQSEVTVVPSFTRRKKVVYTARKKQAKRSPTRVRSARKKCQPLSDNGLVLVRASTENGLPFPGNAQNSFALQVAETDPIQDSQLDDVPNNLRSLPVDASMRPPDKSEKLRVARTLMDASRRAEFAGSSTSTSFAYRGSVFLRPHTQTQRPKKVTLPGPGALCDGFVGQELSVPQKLKMHTRMWTGKKHTGTSMIEANVIESKVSLQLAGGYLPVPSPMSPKISKVDGTPSNGCIQLDFVHASVGNDFDQLRQDIVDPPPRRRTTSIAVRDQLSSITAPMREDNDSESSSNPESDPGNGWGLEDIPGSDLWRPGFDPDRDEMEYFGESMYGLNNRDDNGFWSQYPGLD